MNENHRHISSFRTRLASYLQSLRKLTQVAWWTEQWWKILGVFCLVALIAEFVGYKLYSPHLLCSNLLSRSIELPLVSSDLLGKRVTGWLDYAKLFATLVAAITASQAVLLLLWYKIQSLKLRYFCRDHVVICGLGRKAVVLAEQFLKNGKRLVLIERNENNPSAKRFRDEGAIVLIGDATDSALLRKAQVGRAKRIFCLCPDDESNAQICMQSWELMDKKRRKPISCLVHVTSPDLCGLLRLEMVKKETTDHFRVEFFNIFQTGAWALLNQYPPFDEKAGQAGKAPRLLIAGLGRFGKNVLLGAAKRWRQINSDSKNRLRVTVVDKDAEPKTRALSLAYPKLQTICDVIPWTADIESPEFQEGPFLSNEEGVLDASCIYVCLSDQSLGMRAALFIHHSLRGAKIPIVVCMSDSGGLSALLAKTRGSDSPFSSIHPFNLMQNTCDIRLVHGVTTEILAQAIHANYLRNELQLAGQDLRAKPTVVPWEELSDFHKESNRRQADHIGVKLDAVRCSLAPLRDWDAELFRFTPEEVEMLARLEHQRWWEERIASGWKFGAPRDDKRKIHPSMVPWEQLSKEDQDRDRNTILELPEVLASIDLQIYRVAAGNGE